MRAKRIRVRAASREPMTRPSRDRKTLSAGYGRVRSPKWDARGRRNRVVVSMMTAVTILASLLTPFVSVTPAQAATVIGTAGLFVPVQGRLADSRVGTGISKAPLTSMTPRTLQVTGAAGIPSDGVSAVLITMTTLDPTAAGQTSAGPTDGALAGVMRYDAGAYTSNSAVVMVSDAGQINIQATSMTNVLVDVQGYYTVGNGTTAAGGYSPVIQSRIVDTVNGVGLPKAKLAGGSTSTIQVSGTGGVPSGTKAVFVNFQIDNITTSAGYINPYATSATSRPNSILGFDGTPYTSIGSIVPLAADGTIKVYVSESNSIDLLMDIEGYFTDSGNSLSAGVFTPAVAKIFDTRAAAHVAPGATVTIPIGGTNDIPTVANGLSTIMANVTVVDTGTAGGYARAYASGTAEPSNVGTVTFDKGTAGTYTTNLSTIPIGTDNAIKIHNVSLDTVDYILDLNGYYQGLLVPHISCPAPYGFGTWTNKLPATAIECAVDSSRPRASGSLLFTIVDGEPANEVSLSDTIGTHTPLTIPRSAGWHTIDAVILQADGSSWTTSFSFGLNDGPPSPAVASIEKANPQVFLQLAPTTPDVTAKYALQTVGYQAASVPTEPTNPLVVTATDPDTGEHTEITAELPFKSLASNARAETNGIVSYNNNNGTLTVPITHTDGSIAISTVLTAPSSPRSFAYPLTIPAGGHASVGESGAVTVTDPTGTTVAIADAPWAVDARGSSVPTHYVVKDNVVVQEIALDAPGIQFPVIADPDLWTVIRNAAGCAFEIAGLALASAKVLQAFVKADKIIRAVSKAVYWYNKLGGSWAKVINLLKQYVKNRNSLSMTQLNALEGLLREGGKAAINAIGLGSCWALVTAKY